MAEKSNEFYLKNCPFCGEFGVMSERDGICVGHGESESQLSVGCSGCRVHFTRSYRCKEEKLRAQKSCVEAWNRRIEGKDNASEI